MSWAQRFAQIFGAVYLLVGILGFILPLLIGSGGSVGRIVRVCAVLAAVHGLLSSKPDKDLACRIAEPVTGMAFTASPTTPSR
jgi:hypothetical protein